jgi:hypothetical protein
MSTVSLDRDRELRFDYNAIDHINAISKGRRGNRNVTQLWEDANGMDWGAMAILFWGGNRHEDRTPEWTPENAQKEIRRAITSGKATFRVLNDALNDAMRESEALDLGLPPKAGADEGDEGNAPTTLAATGPRRIGADERKPTESPSGSAD